MGTYWKVQRTPLLAPWGPKWERNPKKRGYVYTNSWFTLMYNRNKYNIMKQLYSDKYFLKNTIKGITFMNMYPLKLFSTKFYAVIDYRLCGHACEPSRFGLVWLFATPWTAIACQAPLSMVFARQEYWNGLSFPRMLKLITRQDMGKSSIVFIIGFQFKIFPLQMCKMFITS